LALLCLVAGIAGFGVAACGSDPGGGDDNGNNANANANANANENGNENGNANENENGNANQNNNNTSPECPNGVDGDGDGYGDGCAAGEDCDDTNEYRHPGAQEVCNYLDDDCDGDVDEGVLNACGNCSPGCSDQEVGNDPFPLPGEEPGVSGEGVGLDPNGDIVLDQTNVSFNYLWIANRYGPGASHNRGTVSKIDTASVTEVARYYTVTCFGNSAYQQGQCLDVAGNPIQIEDNHPSRTAVDYNFDVWVANRAFGGQASTTKIANNLSDCVDRNGNGVIDTSADHDQSGTIEIDCNGDGVVDDITTSCPNGHPPEFLGYDDECVLHTTNYAGTNELGRSVCLDAGDPYSGGAGNAWVGTFNRAGNNRFYKIDGAQGGIVDTVDLAPGVNPYGCAVDGNGILWTLGGFHNAGGRLAWINTANPSQVGGPISEPFSANNHFYGVAVDSDGSVWMGGWDTYHVFRYRPDRTAFSTLGQGMWTRIRTGENANVVHTRGIAADLRGWIWVASNNGYIIRLPQAIGDGDHSWADAASLGAILIGGGLGSGMIGVGIDFDGHVWGMSYALSRATKLELDANGDEVTPGDPGTSVPVGRNPYTYSDFTGYGLRNFTRPSGTYRVRLEGCADPAKETHWLGVEWNATTPQNTTVRLRVRTGDTAATMGQWFGYWDLSPADLTDPAIGPVLPDPAELIEVEFELTSVDQLETPVLHDFQVIYDCEDTGPG